MVLDASVALSWLLEDAGAGQQYAGAVFDALASANAEARVPATWGLEVANVIAKGELRGFLPKERSQTFLAAIAAAPILCDPDTFTKTLTDTLELSRRYRLSRTTRPIWSWRFARHCHSRRSTPNSSVRPLRPGRHCSRSCEHLVMRILILGAGAVGGYLERTWPQPMWTLRSWSVRRAPSYSPGTGWWCTALWGICGCRFRPSLKPNRAST